MCLPCPAHARLIIELKLPPNDAYQKLRHTIDDFNTLLSVHAGGLDEDVFVSPTKNNVVFCSALFGISFTIGSFASLYASTHGVSLAKSLDLLLLVALPPPPCILTLSRLRP